MPVDDESIVSSSPHHRSLFVVCFDEKQRSISSHAVSQISSSSSTLRIYLAILYIYIYIIGRSSLYSCSIFLRERKRSTPPFLFFSYSLNRFRPHGHMHTHVRRTCTNELDSVVQEDLDSQQYPGSPSCVTSATDRLWGRVTDGRGGRRTHVVPKRD